jgi:hypothetical protein
MNFGAWKDTITSVSKAIGETAMKAQSSVAAYDAAYCSKCESSISNAQVALGLQTYEQCRICGFKFCGKCISKEAMTIPNDALIPEFRGKENVVPWLCESCRTVANDLWMQEFRATFWKDTELRLEQFLASEQIIHMFFDLPKPSEDTYKRKAERLAQIAEAAAEISGYRMYFQALKYAYYSKELYQLLIAGDILNMLGPVIAELDRLGARSMGTKGVLQLYYLSCQHKLETKIDPAKEYVAFTDQGHKTEPHLLSADCSEELLDRIGRHLDFGQFLYIACLPAPHNGNDWSSWYLTKLVRRSGWTVIACVNETTKLKNDRKCPSFALLARCQGDVKEAVLVVRGSKSVMDWSINLNEDPTEFTYYKGAGIGEPVLGVGKW